MSSYYTQATRPEEHLFEDDSLEREAFRVKLGNFLEEMYWCNYSLLPVYQEEAKEGLVQVAELVSDPDFKDLHVKGQNNAKSF